MQRVVFEVPDLDRLRLPHGGDTAVGLYFWCADQPVSPIPPGRTYTVRDCDTAIRQLTVDVVIHGHGPGTAWALSAVPGDAVALAHARCWYRPDTAVDWQLLAADLAGLPALARIIAGLPLATRAIAVVEVLDDSDIGYLPDRPGLSVVSSVGTGNGVADSMLAALVARQRLPTGRGYCWFAGEARQARAVRKYFRREMSWEINQLDVMGYWRRDSESWDRRYADVAEELFEVYEKARAAGKSEKDAAEEFDAALERAGL